MTGRAARERAGFEDSPGPIDETNLGLSRLPMTNGAAGARTGVEDSPSPNETNVGST